MAERTKVDVIAQGETKKAKGPVKIELFTGDIRRAVGACGLQVTDADARHAATKNLKPLNLTAVGHSFSVRVRTTNPSADMRKDAPTSAKSTPKSVSPSEKPEEIESDAIGSEHRAGPERSSQP